MNIENLKVGDWITILSWEPKEVPKYSGGFSIFPSGTMTHRDTSWVGDLLEVFVIDPPFIVVIVDEWRNDPELRNVNIDTRKVKIQKCSAEYVKALKSQKGASEQEGGK